MKQIIVEQGNEFKINVKEIKNKNEAKDIFDNDIFGDAYKQASLMIKEIVSNSVNEKFDKEPNGDYLNNIIAFTGDRGQGKSSAMMTYTRYLENLNNIEYDCVLKENTKEYNFISLQSIDPSTFEDMNNILEVVIARMYNNFEKKYRNNNVSVKKDLKIKIMELFQKVYESLCLIRNPKKLEELEYDYEGSIQKIARIGDSTDLLKNIRELVNTYLDIFGEEGKKNFLIISIDDIDVNIKYAYKIAEEIRKYLIIPKVIIIMAINIDQLKLCAEKEFRTQLAVLLHEKSSLNEDEPSAMAAKYVEKLIPDGRKINLPEIRTISKSENDAIELRYIESKTGKDILSKKNRNGIEESLLGYIYDKAGIVFIKPQNGIHNIVPNTLREVVNLLSVLGKMKELTSDDSKKVEIKKSNIDLFEDYFLNTWIPGNLDNNYINIIKQLYSENDFKKHRLICISLMKILENNDLFTIELIDVRLFDSIKEKFREKNKNYFLYSLGDVISILDFINARYINDKLNKFVFSIKTIYTIVMNKMLLTETDNMHYEPNGIYKFIGGDIWGYYLDYKRQNKSIVDPYVVNTGYRKEKVIRKEQFSNEARSTFEYNTKMVLGDKFEVSKGQNEHVVPTKLNIEVAKKIINMTFLSNYFIENSNADFISYNYTYRYKAEFSIDGILISPINLDYLYTRSGFAAIEKMNAQNKDVINLCEKVKTYIKDIQSNINGDLINNITSNMELSAYVQQYCEKSTDIKKTVSQPEGYFTDLINTIEESLESIGYISTRNQNIFKDEEFKNELMDIYVSCFNSKLEGKIEESDKTNIESINEENNKEGNIILQNLSNKALQNINYKLKNYEGTKTDIRVIPKICTVFYLKSQTINLARNISYYQNLNKGNKFSDDVINRISELYKYCYIMAKENGNSKKIDNKILDKYNSIANELRTVINKMAQVQRTL